jgi:hypothetical protein
VDLISKPAGEAAWIRISQVQMLLVRMWIRRREKGWDSLWDMRRDSCRANYSLIIINILSLSILIIHI